LSSIGKSTQELISSVCDACRLFGGRDLIALWGVPGTGKSHVAKLAADEIAGHPQFVKRVQFHQSYTYEDFVEGMRPTPAGGFEIRSGVFTEWNEQAARDKDNTYVLLIEELSRANVPAVLGEILTFIEYRNASFETPISRRRITLATNLVILATMNPRDRSAIELDDAVLRRMRVIECPPSAAQLREMLERSIPSDSAVRAAIVDSCVRFFEGCEQRLGDRFSEYMPFGHGMFAGVSSWDDLEKVWVQKVRPLLFRPNIPHDEVAEFIRDTFPRKARPGSAGSP
jgi:hypothetical protein